ncbi:hypothetical protein BofuT4_uP077070.1 [Botrytis cinerea T4]|uniref:Uncharacterized protein n=1 Tax=Botryotinia fuckeliana (strain T4) TaxID=999810 RepID=G2YLB6_BOTF4|nr:hypothetical protein BofuT4_uP077070.1 [Botrytis cinerea T4]
MCCREEMGWLVIHWDVILRGVCACVCVCVCLGGGRWNGVGFGVYIDVLNIGTQSIRVHTFLS